MYNLKRPYWPDQPRDVPGLNKEAMNPICKWRREAMHNFGADNAISWPTQLIIFMAHAMQCLARMPRVSPYAPDILNTGPNRP